MRSARWILMIALLVTSGCLPHVMHGPRVEENGWSGNLSLTLGRNLEVGEVGTAIVPSLYAGARRSFLREDGRGPAGSIGIQTPLLLAPFFAEDGFLDAITSASYVDLYVQPVRSATPGGWDAGVGGLASRAIAGPYLQAGRSNAVGSGWYTTHILMLPIGNDLAAGTLYMPSVTWRVREAGSATAANFSIGIGVGTQTESATDLLFVLGATFELGLGRN